LRAAEIFPAITCQRDVTIFFTAIPDSTSAALTKAVGIGQLGWSLHRAPDKNILILSENSPHRVHEVKFRDFRGQFIDLLALALQPNCCFVFFCPAAPWINTNFLHF